MSLNKQNGFTLVELMLAMSFVSMLLIAVAVTTIQISNIYNKGISLREVTQAGQVISSELQRNIAQSEPFNLPGDTVGDGETSRFVNQKNGETSVGGRLCTGTYSYLWNYGAIISSDATPPNVYDDGKGTIRFVKVYDPGVTYCRELDKKVVRAEKPAELLSGEGRQLALHRFVIDSRSGAVDQAHGQRLYTINFLLGTTDTAELTSNSRCKPPSESSSDSAYCAVNEFSLTARAGGGKEK